MIWDLRFGIYEKSNVFKIIAKQNPFNPFKLLAKINFVSSCFCGKKKTFASLQAIN